MPGIDGLEATRRLRGQEAAAGARPTPIVALTANGLDHERRSCGTAGFDAFLVKPFEFDDLAQTIERLCPPAERPREFQKRHKIFCRACFCFPDKAESPDKTESRRRPGGADIFVEDGG